jgi:hypothetical protein
MKDKTLYVFDMDDTLIETVKLSDIVNVENYKIKTEDENIKEYIKKIKGIFYSLFSKELCFEKKDDSIIILDCGTKKAIGVEYLDLIQDITSEQLQQVSLKDSTKKYLLRVIEEKNGFLVLKPFPGFYDTKETLGNKINQKIVSIYESVENKMILTGRNERMRQDVEEKLKVLKISKPNFGLYLFPGGCNTIVNYKIKTIEDSILDNGWKEIHFFEDKEEWLEKAFIEITDKFSEIKFHKHLVII